MLSDTSKLMNGWKFEEFGDVALYRYCNPSDKDCVEVTDDNDDILFRIMKVRKEQKRAEAVGKMMKYGSLLTSKSIDELNEVELQIALASLNLSVLGTKYEKVERLQQYINAVMITSRNNQNSN